MAAATLSLVLAAPLAAQCDTEGVVIIGLPTQAVVVGDTASVTDLTPSEGDEYQVVISCEAGTYRHTSRDNRPLTYQRSGCYGSFVGAHGSVYVEVGGPGCDFVMDTLELRYSEFLRTGTSLIGYRGRITYFDEVRQE